MLSWDTVDTSGSTIQYTLGSMQSNWTSSVSSLSAKITAINTRIREEDMGSFLPKKQAQRLLNEVALDLIGPWKVSVNKTELEFKALTCIDPKRCFKIVSLISLFLYSSKSGQLCLFHAFVLF